VEARVRAEWDALRTVMIHHPGLEMKLGLLAPYASLYERAFSGTEATMEHQRLEYVLEREFKVRVIGLKRTLLGLAQSNEKVRKMLIDAALRFITFRGNPKDVKEAREQLARGSSSFDEEHYFTILLLNPLIDLEKGKGARAVYVDITARQPLSNLYFMRDQQAITDRGIFVGRMSKPQRRREAVLTSLTWRSMGLRLLHQVEPPGTFEGGDFMAMGRFALIGMGDRTNRSGVVQLMRHGIGFDEVGVVHQPRHPLIEQGDKMVNMHLDTYFNVASSGIIVGNELLLRRAVVDIYLKVGRGRYRKDGRTNLFEYVRSKGFRVIGINTLEQMCYASNFLCIKEGVILAVETDRVVKNVLRNLTQKAEGNPQRYGRLLDQARRDYAELKSREGFFPHKKEIYENGIDAFPITLTNLTGGYGGAHCMSCTLERN
jgi:arginine deiminase